MLIWGYAPFGGNGSAPWTARGGSEPGQGGEPLGRGLIVLVGCLGGHLGFDCGLGHGPGFRLRLGSWLRGRANPPRRLTSLSAGETCRLFDGEGAAICPPGKTAVTRQKYAPSGSGPATNGADSTDSRIATSANA